MTPAARIAAAIEILDEIARPSPAEKVLTTWARQNRFAGSKDRAAIRDHVFDALRCRRSFAALGGATSGRGLMIGMLRAAGRDPDEMFTGEGHAPLPLDAAERATPEPLSEADRLDLPDWLWARFHAALGDRAEPAAMALRDRAPVFLRVNLRKATVDQTVANLAAEGIEVKRHSLAETALQVVSGARAVARSAAYLEGQIELQDAASQAVVAGLPLTHGMSVLDFCAGGGGKVLAMAGEVDARFTAHDIRRERLADLPARARRAGATIGLAGPADLPARGPFDLVLCDVPCSGSGAWRRQPEGKWRLTPERLEELRGIQDAVLDHAAPFVRARGTLAYATCSLLVEENEERIAAFLDRHPDWHQIHAERFSLETGADAFFAAHLTRRPSSA